MKKTDIFLLIEKEGTVIKSIVINEKIQFLRKSIKNKLTAPELIETKRSKFWEVNKKTTKLL